MFVYRRRKRKNTHLSPFTGKGKSRIYHLSSEKEKYAFITFDVCDFYPSISEDLLLKALNYASRFTTITQQDRHIITHAKKSLLYHQNSPWTKKNANNIFDVTMGSYDGAETCELIGAYMLSLIAPLTSAIFTHPYLKTCY